MSPPTSSPSGARTGPLSRLAATWAALADLLAPATCGGCEMPLLRVGVAGLCDGCRRCLAGPPRRARPANPPPGLPHVYAVVEYVDPIRTAILAYKERNRYDLGKPLGLAVVAAIHAIIDEAAESPASAPLVVVPIPSTRRAVRRRGHDPCAQLARHAAGHLRAGAVVAPALRHARDVADQSGLGQAARVRNLSGALGVAPRWRRLVGGARVVLVDDIVTSGATLADAARAVRAVGGAVAGAAVVAATRLRAGPRSPSP